MQSLGLLLLTPSLMLPLSPPQPSRLAAMSRLRMCTATPPPKLDFLKQLDGEEVTTTATAPEAAVATEPEVPKAATKAAPKATAPKFNLLSSPQPAFDCEASTHEALDDAIGDECDTDKMMRSVLAGWRDEASKAATIERLAEFEDSYTGGADADVVKDALVGTWKLLVTSEKDGVLAEGVSGMAAGPYSRVLAQYQTLRKPDPMDILTGNTVFMTTSELVINVKNGTSEVVTVQGGFQVEAAEAEGEAAQVTEYYLKRETDGVSEAEPEVASNVWGCAFTSPGLRICRLADGSRRTYAKVDADAAQAELTRLRALDVRVDPAAVAEWDAQQRRLKELAKPKKPLLCVDDPNDTRPLWEKKQDDEARRGGGRFSKGNQFGPISG